MTLDATLRPTAKRLIAQYGKTVTFTRKSSGTYDPTTGTNTVTPSSVTIKAVVDQYNALERATGAVESGDVKLTIADMTPAPTVSDSVTFDGQTWAIVDVSPVYSGELIAIYEVQARRG